VNNQIQQGSQEKEDNNIQELEKILPNKNKIGRKFMRLEKIFKE